MLSNKRYIEIVGIATEDCSGLSEEIAGFQAMMQENIELPFDAQLIGCNVVVIDLGMDADRILAIIVRDKTTYQVDLRDLEELVLQDQDWIVAYKRWRSETV